MLLDSGVDVTLVQPSSVDRSYFEDCPHLTWRSKRAAVLTSCGLFILIAIKEEK
jgi:hypothetical protein